MSLHASQTKKLDSHMDMTQLQTHQHLALELSVRTRCLSSILLVFIVEKKVITNEIVPRTILVQVLLKQTWPILQ